MAIEKINNKLLNGILKLKKNRLFFSINPGRSGSQFLAELLGTAKRTVSFHEPAPKMTGEYLQMVTNAPYPESFSRREIKAASLKKKILKLPYGYSYCETSHMFIKTFFDVIAATFSNVQVIVLRREMAYVLKSFIEMGYFSSQERNDLPIHWPNWMIKPNSITSAIPIIEDYENMDQYERCIAYLLDIDARAHRFSETYPWMPTHQIRLEELNSRKNVARFFKQLNLTPTSDTYRLIGTKVNIRESKKKKINIQTSLGYCRERIDQYIEKVEKSGVLLPPTLANYLKPIDLA